MTPTPPTDEETRTAVVGACQHEGNRLACPNCHDTTGMHMDAVHLSVPTTQGFHEMEIHAHTGSLSTNKTVGPVGKAVGTGQGQRIAITGWCEHCADIPLALVFTQHKGVTFLEWAVV